MKRRSRRVPGAREGHRSVRINKFLAESGLCSRRKADELIREGRVTLNGRVVGELGVKVDPEKDQVFVDGRQALQVRESVYILLNKPRDTITSARDERSRTTVLDYVHTKERIFPVGRLDRNTTGVLLLTNDGALAHRLMHPRSEIQKAYQVTLDVPLTPDHARRLAEGVELSDGKTLPAEVSILPGGKRRIVWISIREGRNRQVHRMFESLGYEVGKLDRVSYAGITCEGLPRGRWRHLTAAELRRLRELAGI